MERFKWFDYLGALLLLFSVTKSALTPQVSAISSDVTTGPSASVDEIADPYQDTLQGASDFRIERSNPLASPRLEKGSVSSGFESDMTSEISAEYRGKGLRHPAYASYALLMAGEKEVPRRIFEAAFTRVPSSVTVPVFIW